MLRSKWEFEYTARTLAEAARKQKEFRTARIALWESKKEEVIARIKDSGLTVNEGVAASLNNVSRSYTTGVSGPQVMVDVTMQQDLNECFAKIQEHTEMRKQYAAWEQMLDAQSEARVKLDHDDWMFFFGK